MNNDVNDPLDTIRERMRQDLPLTWAQAHWLVERLAEVEAERDALRKEHP